MGTSIGEADGVCCVLEAGSWRLVAGDLVDEERGTATGELEEDVVADAPVGVVLAEALSVLLEAAAWLS